MYWVELEDETGTAFGLRDIKAMEIICFQHFPFLVQLC